MDADLAGWFCDVDIYDGEDGQELEFSEDILTDFQHIPYKDITNISLNELNSSITTTLEVCKTTNTLIEPQIMMETRKTLPVSIVISTASELTAPQITMTTRKALQSSTVISTTSELTVPQITMTTRKVLPPSTMISTIAEVTMTTRKALQ